MPFLRRGVVPLLLAVAFFSQPAAAQKQKIQLENLGGKARARLVHWASIRRGGPRTESTSRSRKPRTRAPRPGDRRKSAPIRRVEAAVASRPGRAQARTRAADRMEYEASPDGKLAAFVRKRRRRRDRRTSSSRIPPRRRSGRGRAGRRNRVAGDAGLGARPALRTPRLGLPGRGLRPRQLQGLLVEPRLEVDRVPRPRRERGEGLRRSSITSRRPSTRTRRSRSSR